MNVFNLEDVNESIKMEFQKILSEGLITTLYQPIINLQNASILGYEALSRGPKESLLSSPLVMLSIAELLDKTWELERLMRVNALKNATFTDKHLLFLNVDPNVVNDSKFKSGFTKENLKKLNIPSSSIVIELTERSAIKCYADFKNVLRHYTDQGYSVAIDDTGTGYSGLKTLYELYPEYMKIDMDFVRNVDTDKLKQTIVKSLINIAEAANAKTVAEGIETEDELKTLIRLGINYGQGYYIQKPIDKPVHLKEGILDIIEKEKKLSQKRKCSELF